MFVPILLERDHASVTVAWKVPVGEDPHHIVYEVDRKVFSITMNTLNMGKVSIHILGLGKLNTGSCGLALGPEYTGIGEPFT